MNKQKTALLFPGQGSQFVGMGKDLYSDYPEAKAVFDEVDEALGEKLSKMIFKGSEDELNLTSNTQPAIMAASVAAFRVLSKRIGADVGDMASVLAGHSLGEYSAHAVAGTFTLADTARLLRARGNAMQSAVPIGKGGMVALVGCDIKNANIICKDAEFQGLCQIANDNGAGQVVISGALAAMQHVVENAKSYGVKRAIMLPVSAPFHSEWMMPASNIMRAEFKNIAVNAPKIPVIANITVQKVVDAASAIDALVMQVAGQVRWRESMDYMVSCGIDTFIEVGPGKVLSNLISRIEKDANVFAVLSSDSINEVADKFK